MRIKIILFLFCIIFISFVSASEIPIGEKIFNGMELSEMNATELAELGVLWIEEGNVVSVEFERVDELPDFFEDFGNVDLKKIAYLKIDLVTREIFEAEFSVYSFGNYLFGNNYFCLPTNSEVVFKEGLIKIFSYGGIDLECMPFLFDLDLPGNAFEIEGAGIQVSEDLFLESGIIEIVPRGYLIKKGVVSYKKNEFNVDSSSGDLLIVEGELGDYFRNWFRQTDNLMEMKSSTEGYIDLQILEGHEILNTDEWDRMKVFSSKGDYLSFESREDEGLIPRVEHKKGSENSLTKILNDGIEMSFNETGWNLDLSNMPREKADFDAKYQSVAMEIESDIPELLNQKLRINSYRQFKTMDLEDNTLVTFNEYNLPISSKVEDNSLQTIAQMREKYPGIDFGVAKDYPRRGGGFTNNSFGEENLPPYMLYLMEDFFNRNPRSLNELTSVEFSSSEGAYCGDTEIGFGLGVTDPHVARTFRGNKFPEKIIEHEHEHLLDHILKNVEQKKLRNLKDEKLNNYFSKFDGVKKEIELVLKEMNQIEDRESTEYIKKKKYFEKLKTERDELEGKINYRYFEINPDVPLLQQCYNQVVVDSFNSFYNSPSSRAALAQVSKEIQKDIKNELKEMLNNEYGEYDISLEEGDLYFAIEGVMEKMRLKNVDKQITNKFNYYLYRVGELDILGGEVVENLISEEDSKYYFSAFTGLFGDSDFSPVYKNKIEKIFSEKSGLYAEYSLMNYEGQMVDPPFKEFIPTAGYAEVSPILREKTEDKIIEKLNSPYPQVKDTTEKIIQIAFDAGKMDVEKYKRLMGKNHCRDENCCDKKCLIYTFLCEKC